MHIKCIKSISTISLEHFHYTYSQTHTHTNTFIFANRKRQWQRQRDTSMHIKCKIYAYIQHWAWQVCEFECVRCSLEIITCMFHDSMRQEVSFHSEYDFGLRFVCDSISVHYSMINLPLIHRSAPLLFHLSLHLFFVNLVCCRLKQKLSVPQSFSFAIYYEHSDANNTNGKKTRMNKNVDENKKATVYGYIQRKELYKCCIRENSLREMCGPFGHIAVE